MARLDLALVRLLLLVAAALAERITILEETDVKTFVTGGPEEVVEVNLPRFTLGGKSPA